MRFFIFASLILFPHWLFAAVHAGAGLSSTTSGRLVPGLELGIGSESWRATLSSIGVQNAYYYHSSYTASVFATWNSGSFIWGEVVSGFGGGVLYSVRGFRDEGATTDEKKSDIAAGPAFFVEWHFAGPVYTKIDMLWGLRGVSQLVGLNGQDVVFFSFGVRAW